MLWMFNLVKYDLDVALERTDDYWYHCHITLSDSLSPRTRTNLLNFALPLLQCNDCKHQYAAIHLVSIDPGSLLGIVSARRVFNRCTLGYRKLREIEKQLNGMEGFRYHQFSEKIVFYGFISWPWPQGSHFWSDNNGTWKVCQVKWRQ